MILSRRRLLAGTLAAMATTTAASCSRPAAPTRNPSLDNVTYLTNLGTFGRDGYPFAGAHQGFYRAAGINLTIHPGSAGTANTNALLAGTADFAVVDFATICQLRGKASSAVTGLRAVAAIQQQTVSSIITLPRTGIIRAADLEGHTIGVTAGSVLLKVFPYYARLAGFNPGKVKWVTVEDGSLLNTYLVAGKVDGVALYAMAAPTITAMTHGQQQAAVLPYAQYLTDPYGAVLVTTTDLITRKPDLVHRMVAATMRSLSWSLAHPQRTGEILHSLYPTVNPDTAAAELQLMASYCTRNDQMVLGSMDPTQVMKAIAVYEDAGLIQQRLQPEDLVATAMTPKAA